MKRIILLIISTFVLSISYAIGQTHNETTSEDTIKSFLTKMYNDKLYEDYDFLQKHCSPELLQKLQNAYTYDSDGPAYATWLFRSGLQDSEPGSDGKTLMLDVMADGDWYVYTALDMGWEFTNRIKVTCPDGKIIIEDMDLTAEYAKAFVRNSYLYHWHKTQDVDSTIMKFCELAKHLMPDIQLDPSAIKAYIMSAEQENEMEGEGEDLLNIVTAGKYYTPLCSCDIYPYMKEQMSEDTLAAFYNVYDSWKTDLKTALRAIKDRCYREISLELYGNDHDIIGNRDIVKYLIKTENQDADAHVHEGVHPLLDAEAVRVVMKSPKWKPAKKDGKPVRVSYTMPVMFYFSN